MLLKFKAVRGEIYFNPECSQIEFLSDTDIIIINGGVPRRYTASKEEMNVLKKNLGKLL